MSEDAAERRKRLHALREKATSDKNKGRGGGGGGGAPTLKFRNYRPQDPSIDEKNGKSATTSTAVSTKASSKEEGRGRQPGQNVEEEGAEDGKRRAPPESLIQQELKRQKEAQDEDELNIAPKKVNWDLKRDVEKKLDKLNRRTQRAIVEIIRERQAEAANANDGSDGSGSGSDSSSGSEDDGEAKSGEDSGSEED